MSRNDWQTGGQILAMDLTPDSSPTAVLTEKYRRNGKLQSCEPCRKSKLRCDHTVPSCGRCVKRRRIDCYYHPNPLTQAPKSRQTPRPSLPALTPTASISTYDSPQAIYESIEPSSPDVPPQSTYQGTLIPLPRTVAGDAVVPVPSHPARAASAPPLDARRDSVVRGNFGFLGATSYMSTFSEGLGNLDSTDSADLETACTRREENIIISNDRIVRGCQILKFFKERHMINRFMSRGYEICEGSGSAFPEFIMKEWLHKLWVFHGDALTAQEPGKIRRLCEQIFWNTQKPLEFNGKTTGMEWARLGTGLNVRWEVIGLIAVSIGVFANLLDRSDPFFTEHKVARHVLIKKMSEITEACINFCQECESLDDMFVWLIQESSCLVSTLKGDGHYASYKAIGEAHSAVVAMGLHQGSKPTDKVPFWLSELRKRATLFAYMNEVSTAAFLGRPPRLSSRYINLELPLDLTDSQLTLEGPALATAIASLDSRGYSRSNTIHRMTFVRAWAGLAPLREECLDLSLNQYTRSEILTRAEAIQAKSDAHWATLPECLRRTRHEPIDFTKMKPLEVLHRSAMRQGSRANELLLQRVLIRKAGATAEKLIATARAIFKDILQITQRHDIASMFQIDFNLILLSHGLRCGAIIAVELLKQEQMAVYPEKPLLPRSQTIQDLSVFAARLGAVDPTDGTFAMCEQGRKVITKILDKILSPTVVQCRLTSTYVPLQVNLLQHQQQGMEQMEIDVAVGQAGQETGLQGMSTLPGPSAASLMDLSGGLEAPLNLGHDNDFMQWLESVDWERTDSWNGF